MKTLDEIRGRQNGTELNPIEGCLPVTRQQLVDMCNEVYWTNLLDRVNTRLAVSSLERSSKALWKVHRAALDRINALEKEVAALTFAHRGLSEHDELVCKPVW